MSSQNVARRGSRTQPTLPPSLPVQSNPNASTGVLSVSEPPTKGMSSGSLAPNPSVSGSFRYGNTAAAAAGGGLPSVAVLTGSQAEIKDPAASVTMSTTPAGAGATADAKGSTTDSVIEELKALAKSMLEATNAARRRTSCMEHRNSYEALMHAIENRVNGEVITNGAAQPAITAPDAPAGGAVMATPTTSKSESASTPQHVDPAVQQLSPNELDHQRGHGAATEQLTDIPVALSPGSQLRQMQLFAQLQQQQQQCNSGRAGKTRGATSRVEALDDGAAQLTSVPVRLHPATGESTGTAGGGRREVIAEGDVEELEGEEQEALKAVSAPALASSVAATATATTGLPTRRSAKEPSGGAATRHSESRLTDTHSAEEGEDEDGTGYDGVRAQILFKPVNRSVYQEVLASTWKPEGLTRRVSMEAGAPAAGDEAHSSHSSSSDGSEEAAAKKKNDESSDGDEAVASVVTRNKTLKAAAESPTRAVKVYRVPAFPYGGGVTEAQARVLQRQFDACIRNGEHLNSNAPGPALITKDAFEHASYPEVSVDTAQCDLDSFKPTSPYEFVVEVEREVRFDAVKAREERRRRFKRLVHEHRAPATMGTFDLRIIMDPFKTGFEEEKNFPIVAGTVIAGRYEIIQLLGKATFSRAVRCYDLQDPIYDDEDGAEGEGEEASASPAANTIDISTDAEGRKQRRVLGYGQVCLKIINNSKDFFDQALDEIRLLTLLNRQRDPDEAHIVRLIDAFYYKEHVMLVTELLRDTLYDYGKYNREEEEEFYFTVPRLRRLTRQVVEALTYVHSLNLIHTDLKPENIMFVSYSRCIVKVIDFGSSCFLSDHLSSYIQSRSYRAPEVVLGCDYDGGIDVWSLGAILVEMVTGDVLFTSDTVPEMLARIVYVCGTPFPRRMLWEGRHTSDYINKFGCIYEYGGSGAAGADGQREFGASAGEDDAEEPYCLYTPVPTMAPHTGHSSRSAKGAAPMTRTPGGPYSVLREKLAAANVVDEEFLSFVEACLTLDHKKRPTTAQLLEHPFIKDEQI